MNKLTFIGLLALSCVTASRQAGSETIKYPLGSGYVLIAVTEDAAFLELRDYNDSIVDSVSLTSQYMRPEFELKDVALGSEDEFLITTRGGGTGVAESHLGIYGVQGSHIRRFGDFVLKRHIESEPGIEGCDGVGVVSFPKRNELIYRYTEALIGSAKKTTNSVTQLFVLSSSSLKYEQNDRP